MQLHIYYQELNYATIDENPEYEVSNWWFTFDMLSVT